MQDYKPIDITTELSLIRIDFINYLVVGFTLILTAVAPVVLFRMTTTGFSSVYVIYLFVLVVMLATSFFRHRLGEEVVANIIIFVLFVTALGSFAYFGILSISIVLFSVGAFLLMFLHGPLVGTIFAIGFILYVVVISYGYLSGLLRLPVSANFLFDSVSVWGLNLSATASILGFLLLAVYYNQKSTTMLIDHILDQNERISNLANHDELTGLATMRLAEQKLDMATGMAARSKHMVAMLFLDLDGFKQINDQYGHDAGDEVLKIIASRMKEVIREVDTACRIGGDEFIVILAETNNLKEVGIVCERLIYTINEPVPFGALELRVGVSLFPHHGKTMEQLRKTADDIMYTVKKSGKNNYMIAGVR